MLSIINGGRHIVAHFLFQIINNKQNNEKSTIWVAAEPAQSDEQKNVSDAELGRRLGVTRQTVNGIVNGRDDLTVRRLHKIAEMLQVRVRELFDD